MQAYMKSAMPFRGVRAPEGARIYRAALAAHPVVSREEWEAVVRELYDHAAYREERYGALHLFHARPHTRWRDADALPLLEHLVSTGAWWDLVDHASTAVGEILLQDREAAIPVLERWAAGEDIWLAPAAIIGQRKLRDRTDFELMVRLIAPSVGHREFFVGKGIGWALREYSKTDAQAVRDFVAATPQLTPLSRREALKWLERRQA